MNIEFDCECGHRIEDMTRGTQRNFEVTIGCEECDRRYQLTLFESPPE